MTPTYLDELIWSLQQQRKRKQRPCPTCDGDGCMDCDYEGWSTAEVDDERERQEADHLIDLEREG